MCTKCYTMQVDHGQQRPPQRSSSDRSTAETCSVMSRLVATRGFEPILKGHAQAAHRALYTAQGKACLQRWDMQHEDVLELRESLQQDAGVYQDADSSSGSDMHDEGQVGMVCGQTRQLAPLSLALTIR
jgi:hypothetical protein